MLPCLKTCILYFKDEKLRRPHLKGLPPKIKALAGHSLEDAGDMAFAHHELSAENAVIPFSLSQPTSFSQACPATLEMEHFQK